MWTFERENGKLNLHWTDSIFIQAKLNQTNAQRRLLGTVLDAVGAVAVLQVAGSSVGVENAQIFRTVDACGGGGGRGNKSEYAGGIQVLRRT